MRRSILQTKFYLLSVLLSLASCSQDELAEQGTALPEGMYPMIFTAVQITSENTPQTRVSESSDGGSSEWSGGEVIKVTVSGAGNTDCTLDKSGNITKYDPQLYWQNTNDVTVNAWYSNIEGQNTGTGNTVSLAGQSDGLAYVLKAKETTVKYTGRNIELNFSHQLAKIRVKLVKGSYEGDLNNATVKVKGYTSCTVTNGDVSGGSEVGYITMHKNGEYYEANLVPGTLQASEAFEISADEKTVKANLKETNVSLERGKVHTITITVNAEGPKEVTDGETITAPGDYIMKGSFSQGVTLNGDNIKLTLEDVTFSEGSSAIHIKGGTPTIIIKGTNNSLTTTDGPGIWVDGDNANVKITGDGSSNSCIAIESEAAAIGTGSGPLAKPKCGNITIENVKIIANVKGGGAAAIGYGMAYGAGTEQKIGDITIINSIIEATLTQHTYAPYGAVVGGCGGAEGTYQIGDIRITTSNPGITPQDYFSNCTCGDVLVGFPSSTYSFTVNRGKIYWNGVEQTDNITK